MQWYHSHKCFHKIGQCHMCILKIKRFAYEDSICIFPHICRLEKKRLHPASMGEMHMPNAETICTKWQHMQNIHTHMWLKTAAYATSVFYLYFWSEETLQWLPPPWFNVNTGGAGEGGGSVQGRWGAGEGMVGAGEGRVSTAIWLFAVWLLSQLFWRHFWLRDERRTYKEIDNWMNKRQILSCHISVTCKNLWISHKTAGPLFHLNTHC